MKRVTLGDISTIVSGGTPSRANSEYWGQEIPWVKTAQIHNNKIAESDIDEWITQLGLIKSSARIIPAGTILMAMYGQGKTRGQVALLEIDAAINQACAAIILNKNVSTKYVFQQLLLRYNVIRNLSNEGSQKNLNAGIIRSISFPLPIITEQENIAQILSTWDTAIEKTERLIAVKGKRLNWFRQFILTGKIRLPGFYQDWKKVRLGNVLTEHKKLSTGKEEVCSVSVHKGLINQVEHLGRVFAAKDTSKYKLTKPGDIVYTKSPTGEFPLGIIKQNKLDRDVIVSPLYGVFSPITVDLGVILDCYFESPVYTANYLKPIVQKGAKNTINITNDTFLSNSLLLPIDSEEQKKIATIINTIKNEIDLHKRQLAALQKQKRGLMQKLLTGQWRVKLNEDKNSHVKKDI